MPTEEQMDAAKENLNKLDNDIKPVDYIETKKGGKSGKIVQGTGDGDITIKWNVKPKAKLGAILKGNIAEAVSGSSVQLEFGRTWEESNVEVCIKMNGNVAAVLNSPAGNKNIEASFGATKRF